MRHAPTEVAKFIGLKDVLHALLESRNTLEWPVDRPIQVIFIVAYIGTRLTEQA